MSDNKENRRSIDIVGLFLLLWNKRKRILINCSIAFVLAVIIAFSIPKKYTSEVVMAPEITAGSGLGALGDMASLAGVNLGGMTSGDDALYPELYPQIVTSTPFLMDVLSSQVVSVEGDSMTVYDYLDKHTKTAWWTKIYSVPAEYLKKKFSSSDETGSTLATSAESQQNQLTKKQFSVLRKLEKSIAIDVDKGNSLVTLSVTMQDRNIATAVATIISEKLTMYIEEYRSAKARKDLYYTEQLYEEFKEKYIAAQSVYAEYANLHQNVVNKKYQVELLRLENEMELAFGIYSQTAQALEMSRAKVQENTPVCVVIQPAYMPIKASSPKKMMMALLFVFIAFFGTAAWIVIKDRLDDRRNFAKE